MSRQKLDSETREDLKNRVCKLYTPKMLQLKWPGWEIGLPRPHSMVGPDIIKYYQGGGGMLQLDFFRKIENGPYFYCDYKEVRIKYGMTVEERIGKSSGLHFNLQATYWTFNIKLNKWIEQNKREHNCSLVCDLDEFVAWCDSFLREAFFPTPGPYDIGPKKRKKLQKKVLKEFAPNLMEPLMKDIWG